MFLKIGSEHKEHVIWNLTIRKVTSLLCVSGSPNANGPSNPRPGVFDVRVEDDTCKACDTWRALKELWLLKHEGIEDGT